MQIGILGFQRSGKTTVFNALTGSHAQTTGHGGGKARVNMAVVKVPDERLDRVAELIKPQKVTHATVEYVDVAGIERSDVENRTGLGEEQLQALSHTDALLVVIRAFDDGSGIAPDCRGDLEAIKLELILSDLQKIENRLPRLGKLVKKVTGREKEQALLEQAALEKIKTHLEMERSIRSMTLSPEEDKAVRGFTFLSQKPILFLLNVGEDQLSAEKSGYDLTSFSEEKEQKGEKTNVASMCARIEEEISQLSPEESALFLQDYHIPEPASRRVIRLCYDLLGYISFFTAGPRELRAWTITRGTPAVRAAGAVHSDFERGFIRAEVIHWDRYIEVGGYFEARKAGLLRIEGKEYIVQDGDICNFLFNV